MKQPRTYQGSCPECGQGTIKPTRFQNYKTTIRGYPLRRLRSLDRRL